MFHSTPLFQREQQRSIVFTWCLCVPCLFYTRELFTLVVLSCTWMQRRLSFHLPHLRRTKQERVSERRREGWVCACVNTHTRSVEVMRIGANWWCNLFHPPPFVPLFLWPPYNTPPATVFCVVIYRHSRRNTRINWPRLYLVTFLPLRKFEKKNKKKTRAGSPLTKSSRDR